MYIAAAAIGGSALSGCTFTPAYAPGGPAQQLLNAVRADSPDTKAGFDLVERLEERLGRPEPARFTLSYQIETERTGVGITAENATTRYHLQGKVTWQLKDPDGRQLVGGLARSFTSWSATGSTVAGLSAEEDAAYRLMRILADQIVTRLIAAAPSLPASLK